MARLRSIRHPLRRFLHADGHRRALVVEAVLYLALARLGLAVVPFPHLARGLGAFTPPQDARAAAAFRPGAAEIAREIGWAVTRAARYLPFHAVCLPQALAARHMLRRRGVASVLHFGACGNATAEIKAHAWLDAAGVEVTGYPAARDCAEIACFV